MFDLTNTIAWFFKQLYRWARTIDYLTQRKKIVLKEDIISLFIEEANNPV